MSLKNIVRTSWPVAGLLSMWVACGSAALLQKLIKDDCRQEAWEVHH